MYIYVLIYDITCYCTLMKFLKYPIKASNGASLPKYLTVKAVNHFHKSLFELEF